MRKAPLRIRLGYKAVEIASWLLGNRRDVRSESGPNASPFSGAESVNALSEIAVVNACVMRKSLDKARVPLRIGRLDRNGAFVPLKPTTSEDDPQNLIASVNPTEGPASFFARTFAMQAVTGDAFWQIEYLKRARPRELWLLPSDKMDIVKGVDRRVKGYEFKNGDGITKFEPEQVFHSRLPNPANDWRGLSPLMAIRRWAWMEQQIALHESVMLKKGGVPPGFLKFKDHVPVDERDDVRKQVNQQYGGVENANKMGILWGDSDYVTTGVSNKDGDFLALDDRAVRKVAAGFGVPLILLMDLSEASYANAVQQKGMYWQNTLIPELDIFAQDFTELVLWRIYGDKSLVAKYDYEAVEAIQDLRLTRAETLTKLVAGGLLTQNEARAEIGKAPASGGDQLYAPQILQPTGSVALSPARASGTVRAKWIDDPERHAKRAEVGAALDVFEAETLKDMQQLNQRQRVRVLNRFAEKNKARAVLTKDDQVDEYFDLEVEIDQVGAVLARVYSRIGSNRGQSAMEEAFGEAGIHADDRFNIGSPRAQEWIAAEGGRQSKLIAETLKDQLANVLSIADAEGLTISDTAGRIKDMFDLRDDFAALRIARTESARAYNFATQEGWAQSDVVQGKEWLSSHDEAVRSLDKGDAFDHAAMDGVVVGMDEDFEVPGENGVDALAFPSDSKGAPGNTINCRCAMKPSIDPLGKARRKAARVVVPDSDLDALFAVA